MLNLSSSRIKEKIFYSNDIFYSYIFEFERLKDFYKYDYRSLDGFRQKIKSTRNSYDDAKRETISEILIGLNTGLGCSEQTLDNISKLRSKDAFTVTAGQQPGLFTGPIYTVYKAMTAINLSRSLSRELGTDVIPVFWNASDDSLTEEALNTFVYDMRGGLKRVSAGLEFERDKRLSDIRVRNSDIGRSIKKLFSNIGDTDFSNKLKEVLDESLQKQDDVLLSRFFSSLILKLFRKQGIVIIDPASKGLKDLSKSLIQTDINSNKGIKESIDGLGKKLKGLGFEPKLIKGKNTLDFFINTDGSRNKVQKKGDKFLVGKDRYDHQSLTGLVDTESERVSLNVILRPLFQDHFLPNLATICGPGEVGYFAQLKKIYEIFGIDQSIIYPRFTATIIESKVSKSLKRQDIAPPDLSFDMKDNIKRVLVDSTEVDITSVMSELKKELEYSIAAAEKKLEDSYGDNRSPFDRIRRNMDKEVEVLAKKVISALKRKNGIVINDFNKIYKNIFPEKDLQERKINIFYYLNRYGIDLLDALAKQIKIFDFYHRFLEV